MSNVIAIDPAHRAFARWKRAREEHDPNVDWYWAVFIAGQMPPELRAITMHLLMARPAR